MSQNSGLRGVIAGNSTLSLVEGDAGKLSYCGYAIEDLAERITFEECIALLWDGELPTAARLVELTQQIQAEAYLDPTLLDIIGRFPAGAHPMAALRTAVSLLGLVDEEADDPSLEANRRKAIRLTARTPMCVGALHRCREGHKPLPWRNDLSFAGNVLHQLFGTEPTPEATAAIDHALILHADHGLNASTFAYRVTVGTLSDLYSGATSAVGTLKGPLHGGANEAVMKTLLEIGTEDQVEPAVMDKLARKEKIMGFGHAVYTTLDPRARILEKSAESLTQQMDEPKWFYMSKKMQAVMLEEKGMNANVDFFSASLYYGLGIPIDLFTPLFAISRMSGWTAHALEQLANNKLIRPKIQYVGAAPRTVTPIDSRG